MKEPVDHTADANDANDADGFISRWSRRKKNVAAATAEKPLINEEILAQKHDYPLQSDEPSQADASPSDSPAPPVLTDADMPDVETLNSDSDFSPFFSEGVSKELRNLALKKLFFSGKFAARDGLDDYDDDFTKFEPLGDTITSDMKYHTRRKEKARLAALEEEERARLENANADQDQEETVAELEAGEATEADVESVGSDGVSVDQREESVAHDIAHERERHGDGTAGVTVVDPASEPPQQKV